MRVQVDHRTCFNQFPSLLLLLKAPASASASASASFFATRVVFLKDCEKISSDVATGGDLIDRKKPESLDFCSGHFFDVGCIRLVPVTIVAINVIEMSRGFQEEAHFASTLLINASLL